jgi:hypothetical protein
LGLEAAAGAAGASSSSSRAGGGFDASSAGGVLPVQETHQRYDHGDRRMQASN